MTLLRIALDTDGIVSIAPAGEALPAPWLAGVLDVLGGHLTWPVGAPASALPHTELDDPDLAQEWLWQVYGPGAAALVAEVAAGGVPEGAPAGGAEMEAGPGALTEPARRLADLGWALAWWPASVLDGVPPLDERLLRIEQLAWGYAAEALLPPVRAGSARRWTAVARAGLAALEEASHQAEPASDAGIRIAQARLAVTEWADAHGFDLETDLPLDLAAEAGVRARSRDAFALAAGGGAGAGQGPAVVLARGRHAADWELLPAGWVDAAETAIEWTLTRMASGRVLEVVVVGLPDRPLGVPLRGRVRHHRAAYSGEPFELTPNSDGWRAAVEVDEGATQAFATGGTEAPIEVSFPGYQAPPSALSRADREAIREVARRALARPRTVAEAVAGGGDEDF